MSKLSLTPATEDRIRAAAHALWLEEGQPDGRSEAHWLSAVDMVSAQSAGDKAAPKAAASAAPKMLAAAAAKKAAPRKRG